MATVEMYTNMIFPTSINFLRIKRLTGKKPCLKNWYLIGQLHNSLSVLPLDKNQGIR